MLIDLQSILLMHDEAIKRTGGEFGIRDYSLIESAYYSAFQSFGGADFYPTPLEKGIRIGWGLASNHGFIDGNKRTGLAALVFVLEEKLNLSLNASDDEIESEMLKVAESKESYEDFKGWIYDHLSI